jgi:hypothetical protein
MRGLAALGGVLGDDRQHHGEGVEEGDLHQRRLGVADEVSPHAPAGGAAEVAVLEVVNPRGAAADADHGAAPFAVGEHQRELELTLGG